MRARALRKAAVAAGIICALALVVGLMLVRRGAEREVAPPGEARGEAGGVAVAPVEAPAEHGPAFEETVAEEVPPLELRGTLVIVDADGAEHPEEDGEFRILRPASGEEPIGVAVTGGKWRTVWPEPTFPTELHIMDIRAGEAEAEVEGHLPVDASGEIAIRARCLPPAPVLEVIGKDTGAGLGEVKVLLGSYGEAYDQPGAPHVMAVSPHSGAYGPELTVVESGDSPIVLERSIGNARRLQGICKLWARSPGYAWGAIDVDFSRGRQHILALEREASLEVTILNQAPPGTDEEPAVLRIRRASEDAEPTDEIDKLIEDLASLPEANRPLDEQLSSLREIRKQMDVGCEGEVVVSVLAARVTRIEGLPAGPLGVCVELGWAPTDPLILGSARAYLRPGETGRVTITLADPEPSVPFEGTVELPLEWGSVDVVNVELVYMGKVSRERARKSAVPAFPAGPGAFRWDAGKVSAGRYQVFLSDFAVAQSFDVPTEGKRDALIRVGGPVEVRVKVLDAATGENVEDSHIAYSPVPAIRGASVPRQMAEVDDSTREHVFRAPAGRIRMEASSDGYMPSEETLDLSRGTKRAVLRMVKGYGTVLTLDGILPPEPRRLLLDVRLEPLERAGRIVRVEWLNSSMRLTVDSPGLYEIHVPRVEGLAPVEPIRIEIPPDRYVEQTITLRRE